MSRIAGTISQHSSLVSRNSGDLNRLSEDITGMIGEFKVDRSYENGIPIVVDDEELIPWNESLQFNIDIIDQQHRQLLDLINFHGINDLSQRVVAQPYPTGRSQVCSGGRGKTIL